MKSSEGYLSFFYQEDAEKTITYWYFVDIRVWSKSTKWRCRWWRWWRWWWELGIRNWCSFFNRSCTICGRRVFASYDETSFRPDQSWVKHLTTRGCTQVGVGRVNHKTSVIHCKVLIQVLLHFPCVVRSNYFFILFATTNWCYVWKILCFKKYFQEMTL